MPPRPAVRDAKRFFFDCETGGLNHSQFDMVEVAAILTDPSGETVIKEFEAKVTPQRPVDPEAARINGYSAEKWAAAGAVHLDEAMYTLMSMARDAVFVAHNAPFDWGFMESAMGRRMMRWPGSYHKIDTVALSMPLLEEGLVPNVKLVTLTQFFDIKHDAAHTALADVRACRELYLKLMGAYRPAVRAFAKAVA